ncbi:MAG: hypothetical protein KBH11_07570 [Bacteroidia bacterium]|nr:hypothetical protein [Bacteroidota bacterium]MBP9082918.1 hypothetical protein [Bacteroidia bacterium]MBK7387619.1 hypothetical protein [Bacteroidota bacterium]MBK7971267.1 hypothetical protein [Bacteroidota bacterium]MBK8872625.1 hypothetical protein [Bacteroidota bacterium]
MKSKLILIVLFSLTMIQAIEVQAFSEYESTTQVVTSREIGDDYLWFADSRGKLSIVQVSEGIDRSHLRSGLYLVHVIDLNGHSHQTK